ncbi:hypothetical protein FEI13_17645 [Halomonas urmiana]|uniref:MotA/TolQ/ExbB proton channel domain-containing protein n=1 Tax=Halomonas urmiana TaxID=490901 RepID=A0A5R8M8N7_9GAMM|nr:hypothetical protein [Halomonas urmiana]TLF45938.1 hypothetical protein FEI13_17645 [Halomonas urmiana]
MDFFTALLRGPSGLETYLATADAGTVTSVFFGLIAGFFVIALVCYKTDKLRSLTHYTPNLLTSLGMLGTFIGIVIGLLHFDPEDIDGSISLLLGGLQTAFMTSLFGMAMTIIYKVITGLPWLQPKANVASGPDEIGPEHIHQLLREQNENLASLHQAIAGDDSDTLTGQIRLLRQHQDDNHKALAKEASRQAEAAEALGLHAEAQRERFDAFARELTTQMQDFAEMMSKSATEQVINALKEVIQDFNNQLTEQFGENFKALDASVKSLVEWQENYRQQLGEMRDQYAQGVTAIAQTEASVTAISDKATAIPETMSGLETLLTTTQRQLDDLESHLGAFKDMRDRAVEAVPEIRRQVDETVSEINQAAQSAAQELMTGSASMKDELLQGSARLNQEMIEGASGLNDRYNRVHESLQGTSDQLSSQSDKIAQSLEDAYKDLNTRLSDMTTHLTSNSEQLTRTLSEAGEETQNQLRQAHGQSRELLESVQSQHRQALESASEQYQRELSAAQQQLNGVLKEVVQSTGKSVSDQVGALDQGMQEELSRSLTQMGNQLAQITGRFTQDYQQLTNEMHKVVQSANSGAY